MDRTRTPAAAAGQPIVVITTDQTGARDVWTRVSGRYTHCASSVLVSLDELLELRADGVTVTPIDLPAPAPIAAAPITDVVALITVDQENDPDVWVRGEDGQFVSATIGVACTMAELRDNGYTIQPLAPVAVNGHPGLALADLDTRLAEYRRALGGAL